MTTVRVAGVAALLVLSACSANRPHTSTAGASTPSTSSPAGPPPPPSASASASASASSAGAVGCPWSLTGTRRPSTLGPAGGDITLDSRCLADGKPESGQLYPRPQERDRLGKSPIAGFYKDGEQAHVWCAVRTGAPVIDTSTNQSNVWIEVATVFTLGGPALEQHAFVPYAAIGYADLRGLKDCPPRDYS